MPSKVKVREHYRAKPSGRTQVVDCAHCNGTGSYLFGICEVCGGKGKVRV